MLTIYIAMGQANEKIARIQDSYVSRSSETWLESMERTLTQMKEYQVWGPAVRIDIQARAYPEL